MDSEQRLWRRRLLQAVVEAEPHVHPSVPLQTIFAALVRAQHANRAFIDAVRNSDGGGDHGLLCDALVDVTTAVTGGDVDTAGAAK
tara:strand:+ start:160 stop:417 length:258 start_codon:yes stop_codon:yes gene_type:complete